MAEFLEKTVQSEMQPQCALGLPMSPQAVRHNISRTAEWWLIGFLNVLPELQVAFDACHTARLAARRLRDNTATR
jgi:hypothetical protein